MTEGEPHVSITNVHKRFDASEVLTGVDLQVARGTTCVLLGPSGSGKTTLLRLIAGLERADDGCISLGGTVLSGPGTFVAPERRRIGMVFQDWALFPHLTVGANVGFGLSRASRSGARVGEVLEMVGLSGYESRSPGTLSGGQQQRVALARALAPEPEVLLLDEPFSNLDVALRARVRTEVHHLLADTGVTAIFVTHDQQEAFVLGDQVAVMRDGRIVQAASPEALYTHPIDAWVGGFVGDANLLPAAVHDGIAATVFGPLRVHGVTDGDAEVLLRPEHLAVTATDTTEPAGAATASGTVQLVEYGGHDTMLTVLLDDGTVVVARTPVGGLRRHDRVTLRYHAADAAAFPAS